LSAVADAAEAAGFARVGALIDGEPEDDDAPVPVHAALIDVAGRRVESLDRESAGRFVAGADAFVRVPVVEPHALREMLSEEAGRARRGASGGPLLGARPVENASLARVLSVERGGG
ncbi:MAG: hypothetical protein AAGH64_11165, partial [Planctomycetota bacterium]